MSSDNYLLRLYHKTMALPFGRWIFSRLFARKAPYFATIGPRVTELRSNFCEVPFAKRRKVENHIGTVHASSPSATRWKWLWAAWPRPPSRFA